MIIKLYRIIGDCTGINKMNSGLGMEDNNNN